MSCCGRSRQSAVAPPARRDGFTVGGSAPIFEYIGVTSLVAIGSATGREYRFDRAGARQPVDPRDLVSLAQVPLLRRVFTGR